MWASLLRNQFEEVFSSMVRILYLDQHLASFGIELSSSAARLGNFFETGEIMGFNLSTSSLSSTHFISREIIFGKFLPPNVEVMFN
jgi:hypothetical protein